MVLCYGSPRRQVTVTWDHFISALAHSGSLVTVGLARLSRKCSCSPQTRSSLSIPEAGRDGAQPGRAVQFPRRREGCSAACVFLWWIPGMPKVTRPATIALKPLADVDGSVSPGQIQQPDGFAP